MLDVSLIFFFLSGIIIYFSFYKLTYFEKRITVKKKISSVRREKEVFFIIDSNNNSFIIDNCIWLKINPKELWENMTEQKDYMIKGYGLNIPSFDFNYYIVNYAEL